MLKCQFLANMYRAYITIEFRYFAGWLVFEQDLMQALGGTQSAISVYFVHSGIHSTA